MTYTRLCGCHPFYDADIYYMFEHIMEGRIDYQEGEWDKISPCVRDFVAKVLVLDHEEDDC